MNSTAEACNQFKKDYDACFKFWFSEKFLKGDFDDSMCSKYFKLYNQCLQVITFESFIIYFYIFSFSI